MNEGEQSHWFSEIWQEPMGMKGMERVGGERTQKKKKILFGRAIIVLSMFK